MSLKKFRVILFVSCVLAILLWLAFGDFSLHAAIVGDRGSFRIPFPIHLHLRIFLAILCSAVLSVYLFLEYSKDRPGLSFFKTFRYNPQPMWIFDLDSLKFMVVNEAAVSHYGYQKAEFYNMTVLDIRPAADQDRYLAVNQKTLGNFPAINKGFSNDQTVWRHRRKNGELIYVKTIAFYTRYLARRVALITVLDVTESYLQEQQVHQQKELLDALINSTDDFIWAVDRDLVPTASNSSYQRFIREVTGLYVEPDVSNILIRYAAAFMDLQKEYYLRALEGEKINTEREFDLEGFALAYLELKFSPVEVNGEIVGAVCFARNITDRKLYVKKIERQIDALKEIAVLSSHDIRRPVSSILGLLTLVDTRNPGNPENYQILEYMRLAASELDSMIYKIVERCTEEINLQRRPSAVQESGHEEHSPGFFQQILRALENESQGQGPHQMRSSEDSAA